MENYFNYFTDIEEHFQQRRGTILLLSPMDWALIETWKDAGIPLEAVLRGIDATFAKWEKRPSKSRKVNGLGFCAQEVLAAAEELREAEVGAARPSKPDSALPAEDVAEYLSLNATEIAQRAAGLPASAAGLAAQTAGALRELAGQGCANLEDLERRLTVMEDKLQAALLAGTPDEEIVRVRADADRELAGFRRNMSGAQIEQLQKQYLYKRLLERYSLPRLSLFYMT
ncbi:MAG: hypothetical protein ACRD3E_07935 [Terriglobales bacterium]